jgi:hypothetical protein
MNEDDRFAHFVSSVTHLWPRYKTSPEELKAAIWSRKLRHHRAEDVAQALDRHRGEEPDAAKPTWKRVIALLGGKTKHNDFEVLITNTRRDMIRAGWAEAENWSDAEVWAHIVESETWPIQHEYLACTKAPGSPRQTRLWKTRADPEGYFARLAASLRENITAYWRRYFDEIGDTPPLFLVQ